MSHFLVDFFLDFFLFPGPMSSDFLRRVTLEKSSLLRVTEKISWKGSLKNPMNKLNKKKFLTMLQKNIFPEESFS